MRSWCLFGHFLFSSAHIAARLPEVLWVTLVLVNKVVQRWGDEALFLSFIMGYVGLFKEFCDSITQLHRTRVDSESVNLR